MSRMQVTPAKAADMVPVEKSSLWVMPGSLKCTWGSVNPGRTTFPGPASMTLSALPALLPT